jgi:hypothetical protein
MSNFNEDFGTLIPSLSLTLNLACPVKFIEDKERSLTRETYLSFLFKWGEFNWGTQNL